MIYIYGKIGMGVRGCAAGAAELIKVCLNGCARVFAGERYTVNGSSGGCITTGQQ